MQENVFCIHESGKQQLKSHIGVFRLLSAYILWANLEASQDVVDFDRRQVNPMTQ